MDNGQAHAKEQSDEDDEGEEVMMELQNTVEAEQVLLPFFVLDMDCHRARTVMTHEHPALRM